MICCANQLTGYYMRATLALNGLNDKACAIIVSNCLKLLDLMLIFHLSTAWFERFFSKMKLAKTWLWNQLSQANLENLLFIATEAPKTWFTNSKYDFFVDQQENNNNMRINVWSTLLQVFDYQTSCTLLHKTSLICLNIFHDNTIIVYVRVFFR